MRKLATLITAVALAMTLGFAGTAQADPTDEQLFNPGAEDGVLAPWTADDAAGVVVNDTPGANTGDWFFATDGALITLGASVTIAQDVDVTGCGVEGLDGSWTATGFVITDSAVDTGQLVVLLDDASGASSAAVNSPTDYVELGLITGPISDAATNANVSMIGTDVEPDGIASVHFDDMSFRITCVKDFAKISGKIRGTGGKGKEGRAGQYSFAGTVGHMDDLDMSETGSIDINYKTLGTVCTFTPDDPADITYADSTATVDADYECVGGDMAIGIATIRMTQGAGGSNKNKDKDRGSVCVDADDSQLDIGGADCDAADDEVDLDNGNVKVSPPPPPPA